MTRQATTNGVLLGLSAILCGCDIEPGTFISGQIDVEFDDTLNIETTRLIGVVEDPAFSGGEFDLASQEVVATAWCRRTRPKSIELRVEKPFVPTTGANNVIIRIHNVDSDTVTAEATLIQAIDTAAYSPCVRSPYEYGFCERLLPAQEGRIVLAEFETRIDAESVISGSFEFLTDAGTVSGTFRAVGIKRK